MHLNNTFITKFNDLVRKKEAFLFIIDYAGQNPVIYPLFKLPDFIRFSTPGFNDHLTVKNVPVFKLIKHPVPYHEYLNKFEHIKNEILHGNTYLINLTQPTKLDLSWDLEMIYHNCNAPYKLWVKDQFVVFSPEIFVRIEGRKITTFPMKGTIDAAIHDAARILLDDHKEIAEHNTIVDLMRNDLSRIARQVTVDRFRYIDHITTHEKEILQVSSEISGILQDDGRENLGELISNLLPAGSISGAPKRKTVEIIQDVEAYDRGYYTGIFGVFDGANLDSAVMIRFIEQNPSGYVFKSGGGITHLSDPLKEYNELIDKVYVPLA